MIYVRALSKILKLTTLEVFKVMLKTSRSLMSLKLNQKAVILKARKNASIGDWSLNPNVRLS